MNIPIKTLAAGLAGLIGFTWTCIQIYDHYNKKPAAPQVIIMPPIETKTEKEERERKERQESQKIYIAAYNERARELGIPEIVMGGPTGLTVLTHKNGETIDDIRKRAIKAAERSAGININQYQINNPNGDKNNNG